MLEFDPDKRISVDEALKHPYFKDYKVMSDDEVRIYFILISLLNFLSLISFMRKKILQRKILRVRLNINLELIINEILLYYDDKIAKEYYEKKRKYDKENQI